jgi:protein-S-isoprenylcysteine O-methyltransferase Ste14
MANSRRNSGPSRSAQCGSYVLPPLRDQGEVTKGSVLVRAQCENATRNVLLDAVHGAVLWLMTGVPWLGEEKTWAIKHAVNAHKACCPLIVAGLMLWRGDDRLVSWVYLVMHGSYGLTWLVKDAWFPDASWEKPATPCSVVVLFCCLTLFWSSPIILIGCHAPSPPNAVVAAALASYCLGQFFLHTSDAQKYFTLRLRPGLITDGFFSRTRNPNYFGELLTYSGFALLASGADGALWLVPWSVNLLVWSILFVPNWYVKDRSMARHPGFADFARRTGLVFPRLFDAEKRD